MKKHLFSALIAFFFINTAKAQVGDYRIGITLGPTVSYNRSPSDGNSTSVEKDGSAVKFLLGAFVDVPFKENYYFHGGINYSTKVTKITVTDPAVMGGQAVSERYDHEYLQLPLLVKLYTNEVLLDTRLFFNFGVIPEIRLNTSAEDAGVRFISKFQSVDLAGNFGGGIERAIGVNTNVFAALNFNVGFLNQVSEQNPIYDDIKVKNNMFALELGIKF
ncbi:outer membrane beta-barrel protein [Roseivirga sp.]|uniref:outer membrane beta-barrel protein n=1 Tax=Roseivirga sp. TaxID=1964215 RepID=UPI003B52ABD2